MMLAISIPACLGLGGVFVSVEHPFRSATLACYLSLGLALVVAAVGTPAIGLGGLVRLDAVTRVMLILITFIAVIIVRYSRTYLQGDAGQMRYARALMATLVAITILVLSNNLLVIALAWLATSLALHQLLTFYKHRPQARIAAHKKFIVSRLADACMLGATILVGHAAGSLDLDAVTAWAHASRSTGASLQTAAVLLVLAASLKSAQLPFHGWLIQVMEAPTPVSALLHAGIVNIGGFVMIRLAGLVAQVPLAQTLLVLIGMTTTIIAALVMTTRVSIKVALAWSTCAQMGFMLVECGLGAWHLAFLHLVAHSLYKAHAFLSSGTAVEVWRARAIAPPRQRPSLARMFGVSALVLASVAAGYALIASTVGPYPSLVPLIIVVALSVTPLIVRAVEGGARPLRGAIVYGATAGVLYIAGHVVAHRLLPIPEPARVPFTWIIVVAGFVGLFVVQIVLEARPVGRLARALQPRLFVGLHLDEAFTRVTFRLWPPRLRLPQVEARP